MKKIIFIISFLAVFGLMFTPLEIAGPWQTNKESESLAGFNFSAPTAQAMTAAEIQALIQQLQAQIAQLQQQLEARVVPPDVWCHDFKVALRIGDRGAEVRALQTALEKENFDIPAAEQNVARFGPHTAAAVVGFQEKYKQAILAPWNLARGTGFVGPTTLAKLNELYGCKEVEKTECERKGGKCIYFLDKCPTGYERAFYSCLTRSQKCCVPVEKSITVISPNGGEQWVAGSTYEIKWSSQGINPNLPVGITLVDYAQNKEYELETRAKIGDGKFIWTYVPAHTAYTGPESLFSGDKFKIRVYVATKDIAVQYPDESDNYFSIVTASVGLKDIENQLASVSEAVSRLMDSVKRFLER